MNNLIKETSIRFRQTNRIHMRVVEKMVSKTELYRSQHQLLMDIARNPSRSQVELAQRLEISPAAVAVSLKKLEKGGYIKRILDSEDNRVNQVEITEKGDQIVCESRQLFQKLDRTMFQGFSQEELLQVRAYLERMYQNLCRLQEEELG